MKPTRATMEKHLRKHLGSDDGAVDAFLYMWDCLTDAIAPSSAAPDRNALIGAVERLRMAAGMALELTTKYERPQSDEGYHFSSRVTGELREALKISSVEFLGKMFDGPSCAKPKPVESIDDAAEMLWTVLANVSGGDWTKQSADWQEAAARWRDFYFKARRCHSQGVPVVQPKPETDASKRYERDIAAVKLSPTFWAHECALKSSVEYIDSLRAKLDAAEKALKATSDRECRWSDRLDAAAVVIEEHKSQSINANWLLKESRVNVAVACSRAELAERRLAIAQSGLLRIASNLGRGSAHPDHEGYPLRVEATETLKRIDGVSPT